MRTKREVDQEIRKLEESLKALRNERVVGDGLNRVISSVQDGTLFMTRSEISSENGCNHICRETYVGPECEVEVKTFWRFR